MNPLSNSTFKASNPYGANVPPVQGGNPPQKIQDGGNNVGSGVPAGPDNAIQPEKNPVFPPPAQENPQVMPGQNGVANLEYAIGNNLEIVSNDDNPEIVPNGGRRADPKPVQIRKADDANGLYDMETTEGLHRVVQKSVEGVELQFLKMLKADEKIALIEKLIAEVPEGEKEPLVEDLRELRRLKGWAESAAKILTGFLSGRENAVSKGIVELSKETAEQREARLLEEVANMRVSLRNFRSDFDRWINCKSGFGGWFSRRVDNVRNFFTTTRNRFFGFFAREKQQYIDKEAWIAFADRKADFDKAFDKLLKKFDKGREYGFDFNEGTLDQVGDYMYSVADMIECKTEESVANMCVKSVKDQLRNIAENGGYKVMELEFGAGFGVHFTSDMEATVGGKAKYLYRVFSPGDGSVTIEHMGQAGFDAHAKVRVKDILQVDGQGAAIVGGGKSFRYRDLDSATRSVFSIGGKERGFFKHGVARFNPLFIKGRGIGKNLYFGAKYLVTGLVLLPKLAVKGAGLGIDALHKLRTGHHLFDAFDPAKRYVTDRAYFASLKKRGVFKAADRMLSPRKNILMSGKRTFWRLNAGGGANLKLHLGVSRLRLDNSGEVSGDFKARKTDYRTYMTYLTEEQNGECQRSVLDLKQRGISIFPLKEGIGRNPPPGGMRDGGASLEDDIVDVLRTDVRTAEGGDKAVAKRLLGILRAVVDAEEEYGAAFEEQPEKIKKMNYQTAAQRYRRGMLAAAALLEKFESLDLGGDAELKKAYGELRETVLSHFENPSVLFPEDVFLRNFFTEHTTADGKIVTKHEHFYEYDVLGDLKSWTLGGTSLSDSSKSLNLGKMAGRAGAIGGLEGASKAAGLEGSVGITVTEETPVSGGKKAPWLYRSHKTYDLQFTANVTFDLIMRSFVNTLCEAAKIPPPEHGNWKEILQNQVIGASASAFMRAFNDAFAKFNGGDPDSSIALGDKHYVNGGQAPDPGKWFGGMDFWRSGRTIRLEYFDGRLSSVSFGNGEKLSVQLGLPVGAVVLRGGYKFESLENKHSFWLTPSFDALLEKCDSFLGQGNRTLWKMFAQRNRAGFVRMADIYVKKVVGNADVGGPDAEDDAMRIGRMRGKIKDFISGPQFGGLPQSLQRRLKQNHDKLMAAERALAAASEPDNGLTEEARAQAKMLAMRTVLELTVRHFDILQSQEDLMDHFTSIF